MRINNLEFLRIIGCLAIVGFHLFRNSYLPGDNPVFMSMREVTDNAQKAVDLFFILSGFFFVYTLNCKYSLKEFLVKKLVRLYPVLLFALCLTCILSFFHLADFSFYGAISAICGFYGTPLSLVASTGRTYWYCSAMLWTLLLFYYLIKNYEVKNVNLFIGILIFLSYGVIVQTHQAILGGPHNTYGYVFNIGLLRAFGGIGVGYFIGQWYKQYKPVELTPRMRWACTLIEFFCIYFIAHNLLWHELTRANNLIFVITFVITIVLFLTKAGYISQLLDTPRLYLASRYTYSIYMTHTLIFSVLHASIWQNTFFVRMHPYWQIGFALICAFTMGVFTYHYIEVPGRKLLPDNKQ